MCRLSRLRSGFRPAIRRGAAGNRLIRPSIAPGPPFALEQLHDNLLFRWFVGLRPDDPIWYPHVHQEQGSAPRRPVDGALAGEADGRTGSTARTIHRHYPQGLARALVVQRSAVSGRKVISATSSSVTRPAKSGCRLMKLKLKLERAPLQGEHLQEGNARLFRRFFRKPLIGPARPAAGCPPRAVCGAQRLAGPPSSTTASAKQP
jgi:hypothetical protein